NNIWFTEQNSGYVTNLSPSSNSLFQFPSPYGAAAKPSYLNTFQAQTGQSYVSYAQTGVNQIGVLNPYTGNQTQIQSPGAAPTGITYSGIDNTLWWSNTNSSSLTGSYFNSSIVRREPILGESLLASLIGPLLPSDSRPLDRRGPHFAGFRHLRLASLE